MDLIGRNLPVEMVIHYFLARAAFAVFSCLVIVRNGLKKKSLDLTGAIAAVIVGFILTLSNLCFFASCITFFLTSSKLTRFKSDIKEKIEDDFKKGGQRNWIQVFCNGGIPTLLALFYMIDVGIGEHAIDYAKDFTASVLSVAVLGSFACSCGDTWASEIGTVISSHVPVLITTFSKVPVGTNGGITITGTIASILGGTMIGLAYFITLLTLLTIRRIIAVPPQWPVILIGCLGGFLGSMFDSILGATLQYSGYCSVKKCVVHKPSPTVKHISGRAILDNHAVNFVSCLLTSVVMPIIGYFLWRGLM